MIPGKKVTFNSIHSHENFEEATKFPNAFHISQTHLGHWITAEDRDTTPTRLPKNIEPPQMCNSTCLIIRTLSSRALNATIINGPGVSQSILKWQMPLSLSDCIYRFRWPQLPIKLLFTKTINKAQEQSMHLIVINITESRSSHRQHYVFCSRVDSQSELHISGTEGKTKHNIDYEDALQWPNLLSCQKVGFEVSRNIFFILIITMTMWLFPVTLVGFEFSDGCFKFFSFIPHKRRR